MDVCFYQLNDDKRCLDVLIAPIRIVKRLTQLTDVETADLFCLAKKMQSMLEHVHCVSSSTLSVQDGPLAGQTVEVG